MNIAILISIAGLTKRTLYMSDHKNCDKNSLPCFCSCHSFLVFYCLLRNKHFLIWNWQIKLNRVLACIFSNSIIVIQLQRKLVEVRSVFFLKVWSHHILENRAGKFLDRVGRINLNISLSSYPIYHHFSRFYGCASTQIWLFLWTNEWEIPSSCVVPEENTPQSVLGSPTPPWRIGELLKTTNGPSFERINLG